MGGYLHFDRTASDVRVAVNVDAAFCSGDNLGFLKKVHSGGCGHIACLAATNLSIAGSIYDGLYPKLKVQARCDQDIGLSQGCCERRFWADKMGIVFITKRYQTVIKMTKKIFLNNTLNHRFKRRRKNFCKSSSILGTILILIIRIQLIYNNSFSGVRVYVVSNVC